ncbi:MAG: hypothetical protein ACOYEV_03940 [Candidatus Nanopelagicales bacterium]
MISRSPDPQSGPDGVSARAGDASLLDDTATNVGPPASPLSEPDYFGPVSAADAPADWSGYGATNPSQPNAFAAAWDDAANDWGRDYWAATSPPPESPADFRAAAGLGGAHAAAEYPTGDFVIEPAYGPARGAEGSRDLWDATAALGAVASPLPQAGTPLSEDMFMTVDGRPAPTVTPRDQPGRRRDRGKAVGTTGAAAPAPKKARSQRRRATSLVPAWGWAMIGGACLAVAGAVGGSMLASGAITPLDASANSPVPAGTLITQPTEAPSVAVSPTPGVTPLPATVSPTPLPTGGNLPATTAPLATTQPGSVVPLPGTTATIPSTDQTAGGANTTTQTATAAATPAGQSTGDPDAITEPDVAVAGPPSGLAVTAEDRNFGSCPAKFSSKITVQVAYGVPTTAKASFSVDGSNATGSTALTQSGYNTFTGVLSGIPTKKTVYLHVTVSGPDGQTTNEPFTITHSC